MKTVQFRPVKEVPLTLESRFIKSFYTINAVVAILLLSGCANHYTAEAYADPYGFFSGAWHGMIFPFALFTNLISWLLSVFSINFLTDIQIIGRPNTGFFYFIGFFLGLTILGGSGGAANG